MPYSTCTGDVRQPFSVASVDSLLLGDEDVLRDTTILEVSQAAFSASPLEDYISQPFNAKLVVW
jgi:hypothetical protein